MPWNVSILDFVRAKLRCPVIMKLCMCYPNCVCPFVLFSLHHAHELCIYAVKWFAPNNIFILFEFIDTKYMKGSLSWETSSGGGILKICDFVAICGKLLERNIVTL